MAGDWIKMRVDLVEDTDVEEMSDILETDVPTIVGHLFVFWCYADKNTQDGVLNSTKKIIDQKTTEGFSDALRKVGWLQGRDRNLILPYYTRHNGDSSKARSLEAEAKRLRRLAATKPSPCPSNKSDKMSDILSDDCPTKKGDNVRPEKRREEKSIDTPPTPPSGGMPSESSAKKIVSDNPAMHPDLNELKARINALRPKWHKPARWSYNEEQHLFGGTAAQLQELDPDDWETLKEFLSSRAKKGDGYWRPNNRSKFVETFADVWASAYEWNEKNKPAKNRAKPESKPQARNVEDWREDISQYRQSLGIEATTEQICSDDAMFNEFMGWMTRQSLNN